MEAKPLEDSWKSAFVMATLEVGVVGLLVRPPPVIVSFVLSIAVGVEGVRDQDSFAVPGRGRKQKNQKEPVRNLKHIPSYWS